MSGVLAARINSNLRATVTMGIRRMEVAVGPYREIDEMVGRHGIDRILVSDHMRNTLAQEGEDWGLRIIDGFNSQLTLERNLTRIFAGTYMVHVKSGDTLILLTKEELEKGGLILKEISGEMKERLAQDAPWLNTFQLDDLDLKEAIERRLAGLWEHKPNNSYQSDLGLWGKLLAPSTTTLQTLANLANQGIGDDPRYRQKNSLESVSAIIQRMDFKEQVGSVSSFFLKLVAPQDLARAVRSITSIDPRLCIENRLAIDYGIMDYLVKLYSVSDNVDPDLQLALMESAYGPFGVCHALLNYLKARHEIVPITHPR